MDPLSPTSIPGNSGASSQKLTGITHQPFSSDEIRTHHENRRLAKACADFEAIFVEQLFKTMRASIPESGLLDGGRAEEIYTSMLDQQVALDMAQGQGGIGLANQMKARLSHYMATGHVTDLE